MCGTPRIIIVSLACSMVACGGSDRDGGGTDAGTDPDGDVMDPGGPEIVSLGLSATSITEGESTTVTATVTHPDGPEAIAGGSLTTPGGETTYGPFVAAGGTTFSIDVTWSDLHATEPIQFTGGETMRGLRGQFFDEEGRMASKVVDLSLTCAGGAACEGTCTDLMADDSNCGRCGRSCRVQEVTVAITVGGCDSGECLPTWWGCFTDTEFDTCAGYCESIGETCAVGACDGFTSLGFGTEGDCDVYDSRGGDARACTDPVDDGDSVNAFRCCCTDTP